MTDQLETGGPAEQAAPTTDSGVDPYLDTEDLPAAMPVEDAPAPAGQPPAPASDAAPPAPAEYTPEQVAKWREISENPEKFTAANTQRAQELADQKRQLEQQRQAWENDPLNRELMEARRLVEQDPQAYANLQRLRAQGAPVQQGPDPLMGQALQKIRQLEDAQRAQQYEALQRQTLEHVEQFRAGHEMPDEDFSTFMKWYETGTDVTDLSDAYKIYNYEAALAGARQAAQSEVAAVDAEKAGTATGVIPGAAAPPAQYTPVPGETDEEAFARAGAASRARWDELS